MDTRVKALICALPVIGVVFVWFTMISPVFQESQDQDSQMESKRREQIELKSKLFNLTKLQNEKNNLTKDIEQLRGSVPKDPNMDVLMIDVERMALNSGMEVVSIDRPDTETMKKLNKAPKAEEPEETGPDGKPAVLKKSAKKEPAKKPTKDTPVETGLNKMSVQVAVTGDYQNFIDFMKKVESYERVIGVNEISVELPQSKEKGHETEDLSHQLNISFVMTAYYLP